MHHGLWISTGSPGWQYGAVRSTVQYASIFAKKYGTPFLYWYKYGTLVRYASFVMVRVRYVGTLFELKIPDFSHIAQAFCL